MDNATLIKRMPLSRKELIRVESMWGEYNEITDPQQKCLEALKIASLVPLLLDSSISRESISELRIISKTPIKGEPDYRTLDKHDATGFIRFARDIIQREGY